MVKWLRYRSTNKLNLDRVPPFSFLWNGVALTRGHVMAAQARARAHWASWPTSHPVDDSTPLPAWLRELRHRLFRFRARALVHARAHTPNPASLGLDTVNYIKKFPSFALSDSACMMSEAPQLFRYAPHPKKNLQTDLQVGNKIAVSVGFPKYVL